VEPESSGERQGRSWRITKGLWWTEVRRWWTEVRLSAGRAIEPKLVRGSGPPVDAGASVEPEGSGERRRRS
jgi:hypothetical protein